MDEKITNYGIHVEAEDLDGKSPEWACKSCLRQLNSVNALSKCRAMRNVSRCSHYCGPHEKFHIKLMYGPDYSSSLAKAGVSRK